MTPQSVRNYLSGVKLLHVVTGFDFPFYETFELRLTLRGLDRVHRHLPSRAPPVTPDLLRTLVQCRGSQFDFVFNCAFLFAFFLLHAFLILCQFRLGLLIPLNIYDAEISKELVSGYLFLSNGLKLIRPEPKYSPFPYLVILTTFCAQFGLT